MMHQINLEKLNIDVRITFKSFDISANNYDRIVYDYFILGKAESENLNKR